VPPYWDFLRWSDDGGEDEVWTKEGRRKLAFVADGSRFTAELRCRGDFGCVEFQPKGAEGEQK